MKDKIKLATIIFLVVLLFFPVPKQGWTSGAIYSFEYGYPFKFLTTYGFDNDMFLFNNLINKGYSLNPLLLFLDAFLFYKILKFIIAKIKLKMRNNRVGG